MKKYFTLSGIPMYIFTLAFVVLPLLFLAALSFMTKTGPLEFEPVFTLQNYKGVFSGTYLETFLVSLKISLITTVITVIIGYPFAYFMSRAESSKVKGIILLLVILPFWTNALVRIYGFIILFRGNGILHYFLNLMGAGEGYGFLYTEASVIIGMVYGLLPFMILTAYSACEKLSPEILEAARDLGAGKVKTFFTVALPVTSEGLISGITLVFIPSMGLFFISDLLGGGNVTIVGNLIKDQITTSHNYPFAAAIGVIMLILMFLCTEITRLLINKILKKPL